MTSRSSRRTTIWLAAIVVALSALVWLWIAMLGGTNAERSPDPVENVLTASTEPRARVSEAEAVTAASAEETPAAMSRAEAPPQPVGQVDGFVLDAVTGDPVPDCEVSLSCDGTTENVHTDSHGAFNTLRGLPAGLLGAIVSDVGVEVGRAGAKHRAPLGTHGWKIAVAIGPTFPFETIDHSAPFADAWEARLVATCVPDGCAGVLAITSGGVHVIAPGGSQPDRAASWLKLRPFDPPWVRYPRVPFPIEEGYRGRIEVRSDQLERTGWAPVLSVQGVHTPLVVPCERFCTVTGRVEGLARGVSARVLVLPAEHVPKVVSVSTAARWNEAIDDGHGYTIRDIAPGPKVIVAMARGHRIAMASFDTDTMPPPPVLTVEQVDQVERKSSIESPRNPYEVKAAQLRRPNVLTWGNKFGVIGPVSPLWIAQQELQGIGPLAGCFVSIHLPVWYSLLDMPGIPVRACSVTMFGLDAPSAWDSLVLRGELEEVWELKAPPEIRSRDAISHVVLARDSTHELVADAHLFFGPPGGMLVNTAEAGQDWKMSPGAHVAFSVWARGCQPAFGDTSSFVRGEEGRVAEFDLSPGVGAQLFFRARDPHNDRSPSVLHPYIPRWLHALLGAPPVPGVLVEGPGQHPPCSDETGELRVTATAECTLNLRAPGWQLDGLDRLDPDTNAFIVWMKSTAR